MMFKVYEREKLLMKYMFMLLDMAIIIGWLIWKWTVLKLKVAGSS